MCFTESIPHCPYHNIVTIVKQYKPINMQLVLGDIVDYTWKLEVYYNKQLYDESSHLKKNISWHYELFHHGFGYLLSSLCTRELKDNFSTAPLCKQMKE